MTLVAPFTSHRIQGMFSERTDLWFAQNPFTKAVEEACARGTAFLDLTGSNPTRVGLEYDSEAILRGLGSKKALDYDPQAKGLREARNAVAEYYGREHGIRGLDPESVVLTTSTSEGYSFVFRLLCDAGDELLVPKPSYPLFEFLADLQDVKLVPYPLIYDHGWQMDFPSLQKAEKSGQRAGDFEERSLPGTAEEQVVIATNHVGTAALGRPVGRMLGFAGCDRFP